MAQTPTQVTGVTAESSYSAALSAGFLGWSPSSVVDRQLHTVQGGNFRGAWTTLTAYAIGDVVTNGGLYWQATAAVLSSNTTAPSAGATWRDATNKRGAGQVANQLPRTYR